MLNIKSNSAIYRHTHCGGVSAHEHRYMYKDIYINKNTVTNWRKINPQTPSVGTWSYDLWFSNGDILITKNSWIYVHGCGKIN